MDSKLIYSASEGIKYKIIWVKKTPDSEWIYIGEKNNLNKQILRDTINEYFDDTTLLIAVNRKDSIHINKIDVFERIEKIIGIQDFKIWDIKFNRVIEFNKIGVMRLGKVFN